MQSNTRLGILYMVATTLVFALQDGFSQYLSSTYNVYLVVMIRYWFFAAFVIAITAVGRAVFRQHSNPNIQFCKSCAEQYWQSKSVSW